MGKGSFLEKPILIIITLITLILQRRVSTATNNWKCQDSRGQSAGVRTKCNPREIIAIERVDTITSGTTGSCVANNNFNLKLGDQTCCIINENDTCNFSHSVFQEHCSGRNECQELRNYPGCNSAVLSHVVEFQCVQERDVKEMCQTLSAGSSSDSIYFTNKNYLPMAGSVNASFGQIYAVDTNCSCSVEVDACYVNLTIFSVHVDLARYAGVCKQSLSFYDGDGNLQYTLSCGNKALETLYSTASNYVKIQFMNSVPQNGGAFWIGIKALFSDHVDVVLQCPAIAQQHCLPTRTSSTSKNTNNVDHNDSKGHEGLKVAVVMGIVFSTVIVLVIAA